MSFLRILPAREFPLDEEAIRRFRAAWQITFEGNTDSTVYHNVTRGIASPGIEYYLPLFFERTATLFDYLPSSSTIIGSAGLEVSADSFWREIKTRYESFCNDRHLLRPNTLYLQTHEVFLGLNKLPRVTFHRDPQEKRVGTTNFDTTIPPELTIEARALQPLGRLLDFLRSF